MDTARFRGPVPGRIRRRPAGVLLQQRWRLLTRQSLWGAAVMADRCYCRARVRSPGKPRIVTGLAQQDPNDLEDTHDR